MLELVLEDLHREVGPSNRKLLICVLSVNEVVQHDEEESQSSKLKLIVDPVVLRLVLEEADYFIFQGLECTGLWCFEFTLLIQIGVGRVVINISIII